MPGPAWIAKLDQRVVLGLRPPATSAPQLGRRNTASRTGLDVREHCYDSAVHKKDQCTYQHNRIKGMVRHAAGVNACVFDVCFMTRQRI